jgi:hypothetical protein
VSLSNINVGFLNETSLFSTVYIEGLDLAQGIKTTQSKNWSVALTLNVLWVTALWGVNFLSLEVLVQHFSGVNASNVHTCIYEASTFKYVKPALRVTSSEHFEDLLTSHLKGYLCNWPHYYRVVRSKLVFYNMLTTSINNTHIKRKNSKTICSSETISSRIFGSAPISPNTRCHLCNLVGLTSLWHSHRRVYSAGSTFTFFKSANCISRIPHALPRQRNAAPLLNLGAR